VAGQPTVEARARARDGSRSRRGALAEQVEAERPRPLRLGLNFLCGADPRTLVPNGVR
jgi:hypothetical protein